jgi:hypothetical protein
MFSRVQLLFQSRTSNSSPRDTTSSPIEGHRDSTSTALDPAVIPRPQFRRQDSNDSATWSSTSSSLDGLPLPVRQTSGRTLEEWNIYDGKLYHERRFSNESLVPYEYSPEDRGYMIIKKNKPKK